MHALIIEDEAIIALEIRCILEDIGFNSSDIVSSPSEAIESARRRRPDLVTADFRIEGGTGVQAVEMIVGECGSVPVVYVTGNIDQVHELGRPVVEKPITRGALERAQIAAIEGRP